MTLTAARRVTACRLLLVPAALAFSATLAGCGPHAEVAADCLAIPDASAIELVKVTTFAPDGGEQDRWQIDTRPRVEALVAALRARSGGSCKTALQKRPQELSVALEARDSVPLILWIGPDTLGGVDTMKDAKGWLVGRWRPMQAGEHDELVDLVRREGAPSTRSGG